MSATRAAEYLSDLRYNTEHPRRIRAAVVGCGSHAVRNIVPTFQYAPVDLVAVRPRQGAWPGRGPCLRVQTSYTNLDDMLAAESPEVVFAALNFDTHGRPRYPDAAVAAREAGARVWIEKPPASSVADIERMIRATG